MKRNRTTSRKSGDLRGWGTIEAIIAVVAFYMLASAGIDWVNSKRAEAWNDTRLQELAQEMVIVSRSARTAGLNLTIPGNVVGTVEKIAQGGVAGYGAFEGQFFGIRDLDDSAKQKVTRYLKFEYGQLIVEQPDPDSYASN